jgi:glycosyltransferase involved in cell wall biosynthesis
LVYAPHAVDNKRFAEINSGDKEELDRWRKRLGIAEDDWVVLFAGKLEEKKNPRFILQLAQKIGDPHVRFLVVGNGMLEGALKAQNTDNRVIFLPFQNQSLMPVVYRLGQVLLLPSRGPGETWGLAANEAMASGLPVILSAKVGGAPDLVGEKGTGLIFEGLDVDTVTGYIRKLSADCAFYEDTSRRARQHISHFNYETIAATIEKEVMNREEPAECGM